MRQCLRTACLLLLVVAGVVGSTTRSALAMQSLAVEAESDSRMQQAMSQDCPTDVIAELSGLSCDGDTEMPARQPGCPMMMNSCVNMGSAAGHCGLVSVSDPAAVPGACTRVAPVVFMQSAVLGSGRVADPIFHPPIL